MLKILYSWSATLFLWVIRLFLLYFVSIRRIFLSDYSFSLLQKWCLKRYIRTWLLSGSSVEYLIFLICKFFPVSFRLFLLYFVGIRRISQLFFQIIVFHCCRNDVWNDISELCRDLVLQLPSHEELNWFSVLCAKHSRIYSELQKWCLNETISELDHWLVLVLKNYSWSAMSVKALQIICYFSKLLFAADRLRFSN